MIAKGGTMTNWTFLGWYYRQGGEQIGPVPSAEIARLVGCGQLRPSEEVLKGWKDANKVRFFGNPADPEASRPPRRAP
jgi:GYF domain 2